MPLTRFLAAQAVAREAGALMKRRFLDRNSFTLGFKGHQDYITEVDTEVENLVLARLGAAFPGDGFIGEEGGGKPAPSLWVIDPIDGTANFARGIPHFCISIAHVSGNEIDIGVIYDPVREEIWTTQKGGAAKLNGSDIHVSERVDLAECIVSVGLSKTGVTIEAGVPLLQDMVHRARKCRLMGSAALDMAYVACGRLDAYLEQGISLWDVAAGWLLIENAGGFVKMTPREDMKERYRIIAHNNVIKLKP